MYELGQRLSWNGEIGTVIDIIDYKRYGNGYVRLSMDSRNGLPYWVEFARVMTTQEKVRKIV